MNTEDSTKNSSLGKWMLAIAFMIMLGLFTLFFDGALNDQRNPNQDISVSSSAGSPEVILQRNRYGHYIATGNLNEQTVEFLLDTGATDIAIPEQIAKKLKLQRGPEIPVNTANGQINVIMTKIDRVTLGAITLHNIRANINPYMQGDQVLLGMSFLKHLELIQRGDTLILRQY